MKDNTFQKKEQLQKEDVKTGQNVVYSTAILRIKHCHE